jgi:hypothetical protein
VRTCTGSTRGARVLKNLLYPLRCPRCNADLFEPESVYLDYDDPVYGGRTEVSSVGRDGRLRHAEDNLELVDCAACDEDLISHAKKPEDPLEI